MLQNTQILGVNPIFDAVLLFVVGGIVGHMVYGAWRERRHWKRVEEEVRSFRADLPDNPDLWSDEDFQAFMAELEKESA